MGGICFPLLGSAASCPQTRRMFSLYTLSTLGEHNRKCTIYVLQHQQLGAGTSFGICITTEDGKGTGIHSSFHLDVSQILLKPVQGEKEDYSFNFNITKAQNIYLKVKTPNALSSKALQITLKILFCVNAVLGDLSILPMPIVRMIA